MHIFNSCIFLPERLSVKNCDYPESADIPPVGAAMYVDFDLWTKILNLSLTDKYQS